MSQVVVVTGGAGGIGSAVCRALAEDGHFASLRSGRTVEESFFSVRPERSEAKSKDAAPGPGSAGLGTQSPIP